MDFVTLDSIVLAKQPFLILLMELLVMFVSQAGSVKSDPVLKSLVLLEVIIPIRKVRLNKIVLLVHLVSIVMELTLLKNVILDTIVLQGLSCQNKCQPQEVTFLMLNKITMRNVQYRHINH